MLTVSDLLRGDIQLASPPMVYTALKQVIEDPTKSARDAAFVIENDAALTARLLKIVNSALYGLPGRISSITIAITLVGVRELQNLTLAASIVERFLDLNSEIFSIYDFWSRNLRCALIARELDRRLGGKYRDNAFVCGLLHNIGQLVLYRRIPDLAKEADLLIRADASQIGIETLIEQQVIGLDHFQVGAELCKLWKLPEVICESIRLHSYPDDIGTYAVIAGIVRTAHYLSKADTLDDALLINELQLSAEQVSAILDLVHDEFETIFKVFYPYK
ncbi:MAG: HDOD domain-containing protein [Gammaproteobacteria bacterium]